MPRKKKTDVPVSAETTEAPEAEAAAPAADPDPPAEAEGEAPAAEDPALTEAVNEAIYEAVDWDDIVLDEDDDWGWGDDPSPYASAEEEAAPPTPEALWEEHTGAEHPTFGMTLGDAEFVGLFEDGSDDWHGARTAGIGGSEASTVLGINRFQSPYVLWHIKKGLWEADRSESEVLEWGHRLERPIIEKFLDEHPEWEYHPGGSWRKIFQPRMLANPDGILVNKETGEIAILEIKTSKFGTGWEYDRVPEYYVAQVRHYQHVLGIKRAFIAVLRAGSEYMDFEIPYDPDQYIEKLTGGTKAPSRFKSTINGPTLEIAEMNFLDSELPPPIDAGRDTYELLRKQNMSLEKGKEVELPVEVGTKLLESVEALKKAQEEEQEARNHVMAHMGVAQYAVYNDQRVAVRVAKGTAAPFLKLNV